MSKKIKSILAIVLLSVTQFLYAEETPIKGLNEYKLENGLTLFTKENHNSPLVYIEIAVKAGAVTQNAQNAGLFHLYEHMMFKGNSLYKDAASVNKALSDLGVANWNGTTGTDRVNYFFTIPSNQLERGLEFWSAAIRTPLMDKKELENEKKVVLSEIEGDIKNPNKIVSSYVNQTLFPNAPYRTDSAGSFSVVKNATVEQLKQIQKEFYIPSNAVLFVGGDIKSDEVFELTKKIYGDWSNNNHAVDYTYEQQNTEPLEEEKYCYMNYENSTKDTTIIEINYRGPDTDFDLEDTYIADYLLRIIYYTSAPHYKKLMTNRLLNLKSTNDFSMSYGTVRANGILSFEIELQNSKNKDLVKAKEFYNLLTNEMLPAIASNKYLYTQKVKDTIIEDIKEEEAMSNEKMSEFFSSLRWWWTSTSTDYWYKYYDKINEITQDDVKRFIKKYFTRKPLILILKNETFEKVKELSPAFTNEIANINEENTFWFEKEFYQNQKEPDKVPLKEKTVELKNKDKIAKEKAAKAKAKSQKKKTTTTSVQNGNPFSFERMSLNKDTEKSEIKEENKNEIKRNIRIEKLNNGIPVYICKTDSRTNAISICTIGGVSNVTKETAGLERALFSLMYRGSKYYNEKELSHTLAATNSSLSYENRYTGSSLTLRTLDKYCLPNIKVLADCFINPLVTDESMQRLHQNINSILQDMETNPEEILYTAVQNKVFENHPYLNMNYTRESAGNITKENLQKLHKLILNPQNMFIVAVGNIGTNSLVYELNQTFGMITQKNAKQTNQEEEVKPAQITKGEDIIITHPQASGAGYAARIIPAPSNTSDEYITACIAADMYSDILFNVVREHHGACYSPSSYIASSKASYGVEYIYKLTDYENYKKYMKTARDYMTKGILIESTDKSGNYKFSKLKDRLESYKNSYINKKYMRSETSYALATQLSYNVMQSGDIDLDLKQVSQIEKITTQDILDSFNKYWNSENELWFLVKGE